MCNKIQALIACAPWQPHIRLLFSATALVLTLLATCVLALSLVTMPAPKTQRRCIVFGRLKKDETLKQPDELDRVVVMPLKFDLGH